MLVLAATVCLGGGQLLAGGPRQRDRGQGRHRQQHEDGLRGRPGGDPSRQGGTRDHRRAHRNLVEAVHARELACVCREEPRVGVDGGGAHAKQQAVGHGREVQQREAHRQKPGRDARQRAQGEHAQKRAPGTDRFDDGTSDGVARDQACVEGQGYERHVGGAGMQRIGRAADDADEVDGLQREHQQELDRDDPPRRGGEHIHGGDSKKIAMVIVGREGPRTDAP